MSSLFTQISQEVARQQQQLQQSQQQKTADDAERTIDRPEHSVTVKPPKESPGAVDQAHNPNERTEQPNGESERTSHEMLPATVDVGDAGQSSAPSPEEPTSLIDEMRHGVDEVGRSTERYSFEIYTDQKDKILEVAYRYQKRTGKRLPKSRIIREALDQYLNQILEQA